MDLPKTGGSFTRDPAGRLRPANEADTTSTPKAATPAPVKKKEA